MKPIKNFPGYYIKSNGEVVGKRVKTIKPRILTNGYCAVEIYKDGKKHLKRIHRLLLEHFHSSQPKGKECNHKNGIKTDNRLENLEWVTRSENCIHAYENGLVPKRNYPRGEKAKSSKLKEDEVWLIKKILKSDVVAQRYIAKMFGVSQRTITSINMKKSWGWLEDR